jgi:hypothetical protein
MTNREWLNSRDNKEMARIISDSCAYCTYHENRNCSGGCVEGITEWLNAKHEKPMPEIKIGDVLRFKISNSNKVHTATVIGEGYMYSSDYGLTTIGNSHYKIIEALRFNGEKLETIWRTDNG